MEKVNQFPCFCPKTEMAIGIYGVSRLYVGFPKPTDAFIPKCLVPGLD